VNLKTATVRINANVVSNGGTVKIEVSNLLDLAGGASITTTGAANTVIASGAVDFDATGAGTINLAGSIVTTGSDHNAAAGNTGGGVTIDTANGTIGVAAITSSGGNATTPDNNGGVAGAITVSAGTGKQVTLTGNLVALGGTPSGTGAAGAKANATIGSTGTILISAAVQTQVQNLVLNGGTIDIDDSPLRFLYSFAAGIGLGILAWRRMWLPTAWGRSSSPTAPC
jgi:hypothetical protein